MMGTFKRDRAAYVAREQAKRDEQAMRPAALGDRVYGGGDDNVPGGRDTVGHSAVQGWSAGDIFPAVITVVESYHDIDPCHRFRAVEPIGARLRYRAFDLTLDGRTERFSNYDDARAAARALLADPAMRAAWRAGE
jgi:hypothetical protein